MSGFLILLGMGAVTWWAWPAADTFPAKVWTITFAVFLCPFSWPWLAARGYRARKAAKTTERQRKLAVAEQQRQENVQWWVNEFQAAQHAGDADRQALARDTLIAMGESNPWR